MKDLSEKLIKFILSHQSKKESDNVVSQLVGEDFIPYVCNYDQNTILTKNGDLLQTIKIDNFNHNPYDTEIIPIRESIRDAISKHVKDSKFGLYFHLVRKKRDISLKCSYDEFFADLVNKSWIRENQLDQQLVNELYITIVIEGVNSSITNLNTFWHSFFYSTIQSSHKNHLKNSHKKLSQITTQILVDLTEYGAKLLGYTEIDGKLCSDFSSFFNKILNFEDRLLALQPTEIAGDLLRNEIAFGNRDIEIKSDDGKKFGAILSLKEYHEFEIPVLDRLLQLPIEFIITQSFDFNVTKKDLEAIEYQDYILQLSGDDSLRQISGIESLITGKHENKTDYGNLQTTIMIVDTSLDKLQKDVDKVLESAQSLSSILIREDIFLEHCFWSQLPANFQFLRRQKIMATANVPGFCNLNNYPVGKIGGDANNQATTIFKTVLDTPYFFDLFGKNDKKNLSHTIVVGPKKSGKTTLVNFLLAQARKSDSKIFYFDSNKSSECFIRALWGNYLKLDDSGVNPLKMNPLLLAKNDQNKQFLISWFGYLLAFAKEPIAKQELDRLPPIVERIYNDNIKDFTTACKYFNQENTRNIYNRLRIWFGDGQLSTIFKATEESDLSFGVTGFDLSKVSEYIAISLPIITYLLYKIEASLNQETRSFIVFDNSWQLIDNKIFAPILGNFLQRMQQKNCTVIFTFEEIKQVNFENLGTVLKRNLATEIYLPNPNLDQYYQTIFGLSDEELTIIESMRADEHHFLFKNNNDSVISYFTLSSNNEIAKILSADEVTLTAMNEVIAASF